MVTRKTRGNSCRRSGLLSERREGEAPAELPTQRSVMFLTAQQEFRPPGEASARVSGRLPNRIVPRRFRVPMTALR